MGRLAVVGGHGILGTAFAADASRVEIDTPDGRVSLLDATDWVVIQRHGLDQFVSAPYINYRAHVRALADLGCDRILGLASVGSLRPDLPVGTFVAPDDFIALHLGISFSHGDDGHQSPGFDPAWRRTVAGSWAERTDVPLHDGGVYWQTIGPRFETRAEIRLIAGYADLVGMTIATECILARELGLAYASVCVVDNLANGIDAVPLSMEEFRAGAAANRARLVSALDAVLPAVSKEAESA
ncbi:MAG TPA: MTAP family purine nucleoside phosphorylase [Acidimicrobiia bacterium]|nr:MTAP family purine nucleoside phosphorylase [Acidimicrobiia bacterium]